MDDELINSVANLDEEKTLELVKEKIKNGETPFKIIEQCRKGVERVGEQYSNGTYYLSDLIMSEEIFREVAEIIEPYFPINNTETKTNDLKVIMGTIEGDIHDLGKNIVIYLLRSAGYQVYDLGVDVPPEKFIEAIKETGAEIIGVCVLLTFCIGAIKKLVNLLTESGLRDKVVVVMGGYPVNEQVREFTGADYFSNDANNVIETVREASKEALKKENR
jgi:methylmalonyl-CoA mutase cobalamin-binding domain/chain